MIACWIKSLVIFSFPIEQDVRECEGPLEVLQDLNQDVREKILELKGRIKVWKLFMYSCIKCAL